MRIGYDEYRASADNNHIGYDGYSGHDDCYDADDALVDDDWACIDVCDALTPEE